MTRVALLYKLESGALPSKWTLLSLADSLGSTPLILRVSHSQTLWIPLLWKNSSTSLLLIELITESLT